jgi:hypothetical protein
MEDLDWREEKEDATEVKHSEAGEARDIGEERTEPLKV